MEKPEKVPKTWDDWSRHVGLIIIRAVFSSKTNFLAWFFAVASFIIICIIVCRMPADKLHAWEPAKDIATALKGAADVAAWVICIALALALAVALVVIHVMHKRVKQEGEMKSKLASSADPERTSSKAPLNSSRGKRLRAEGATEGQGPVPEEKENA